MQLYLIIEDPIGSPRYDRRWHSFLLGTLPVRYTLGFGGRSTSSLRFHGKLPLKIRCAVLG